MDLAIRYENQFQPYVEEAVRRVGPFVWRQLVREARRHGHNAREAVNNALYRVRDNVADYRDHLANSRKRDRSGNPRNTKKNTEVRADIPVMSGSGDIHISRETHRIGRTKKRTVHELWKSQLGMLDEYVWRWQRCSSSLLGPGATPICMGRDDLQITPEEVPTVVLPVHVMSLTNCPLFDSDNDLGAPPQGMARIVYRKPRTDLQEPFQGNFGYQWLNSNKSDGSSNVSGVWEIEKGSLNSAVERSIDTVFHKYSDIRLNLYGSLRYPLDYTVMVVSGMPEEMQVFNSIPVTSNVATNPTENDFPIADHTPLNDFLMSHVRPLVSNPILGYSGGNTSVGKYKIVSQRKVHVPCLNYTDALNLTHGNSLIDAVNVRSVNMFIRHDRYRNYKWRTQDSSVEDNDNISGLGWDKTEANIVPGSASVGDVDYEKRLFLVIVCNSVQTVNAPYNNVSGSIIDPVVPQTEAMRVTGSYDIVVRNCFRAGNSGLYVKPP